MKIINGFNAAMTIWLAVQAAGQTPEELDFISRLEEFRAIRNMLPAHVDRLAHSLLEERKQRIARLASSADVAERKAYVRERMLRAIGGLPDRTPLNARAAGVLERDEYRIEKVIFESQPRFYVTANLYVPQRGRPPYPGILFPLGHETGAKAHSAWQQMLGSLAKKGYVALAWDPIGQGERAQLYDPDWGESKVFRSTTEHTIVGIQCLLVGDSLARYTIWDAMRALDYLLSRPEVDASRIGCTGNSGGGTHTAYLAALDDRIKVAAPSCYLTSWSRLLESIGPQDAEQNLIPWLRDGLDHADFVYAFAPKPYLILSAIRDFFSISGARETYEEAKRLYALLGAQEHLSMVEADDYHGYTKPRRMAAYRWFGRWLKGVEDQEAEPQIKTFSEEELRCTETGQVSTSLGGETVFSLNKKRAEALARKSPSSPKDLAGYKDKLRERVRQLTGFEPSKAPLVVRPYGSVARSGYRIEKLVYESEPGILVPALMFIPESAAGRKPAVLYVHPRGKGGAAGPDDDIEQWVKGGSIVLAIDTRGSGETQVVETQQANDFRPYFGNFDSAMTALLVGKPLVGMRALDVSRGIDLLATRVDVDPEKIFGIGKESGCVPLLYAAVLDERIKKLALEGMLVSYQSVVNNRIHRQVFENVVPGALKFFDLPDLVATLAPRPAWIVNGLDPLGHSVRLEEVRKQYAAASEGFRLAGAETAIRVAERRADDRAAAFYQDFLK